MRHGKNKKGQIDIQLSSFANSERESCHKLQRQFNASKSHNRCCSSLRKKKGQIDIQFNWVFMLIIGGVILLFFFGLILKQKDTTETKIAANIKEDLSSIMTGSSISTGTASLIEISEIEMEFDCEGYRIGSVSPIDPHISFSPNRMVGNELIVWSLDWNVPYRVANFLYITSPRIRYVIVDDAGYLAEELNETLPPGTIIKDDLEKPFFVKEIVKENELANIKDQNYDKIRFIFFGKGTNIPDTMLDDLDKDADDISAISINGNSIDGFGNVYFFKKSKLSNTWTPDPSASEYESFYLGQASLIGAIFTEDIETYECNMQNAFDHFSIVTMIYENKTNALVNYYKEKSDTSCQSSMVGASDTLEKMRLLAGEISETLYSGTVYTLVSELYNDYILNFIDDNDNIQRLSCAEIY